MPSQPPSQNEERASLIKPERLVKGELFNEEGTFGRLYFGFYTPAAASVINDEEEAEHQQACVIKEAKHQLGVLSLLRERKALARIKDAGNHENVQALLTFVHDVRVVFCCFRRETMQVVTEHYEGGDLLKYMGELPDDGVVPLAFFRQIVDALKFIHGLGIVHRDVKEANVFLDQKKENCKLGDFGGSRCLDEQAEGRVMIMGTFDYLAPEFCGVIFTASNVITKASDIYSLAIMFWAMLCPDAEEIYPGYPTPIAACRAVKNQAVRPSLDKVDHKYHSLLTEMWKQKPADRPSIEDVGYQVQNLFG